MFTLEDMRNIVHEELEEQVKALMGVMCELQNVKKMIAASQEVSKKIVGFLESLIFFSDLECNII